MSCVRSRTSTSRPRAHARSTWAPWLRCWTGASKWTSSRPRRASTRASDRSVFVRLFQMSRTWRGFATIASCPTPRINLGDPARVHSYLQNNSSSAKPGETLFQAGTGRPDSILRNDGPMVVEYADLRELVAHITAYEHGDTILHGRSPLDFESAPRDSVAVPKESGLLIPSPGGGARGSRGAGSHRARATPAPGARCGGAAMSGARAGWDGPGRRRRGRACFEGNSGREVASGVSRGAIAGADRTHSVAGCRSAHDGQANAFPAARTPRSRDAVRGWAPGSPHEAALFASPSARASPAGAGVAS